MTVKFTIDDSPAIFAQLTQTVHDKHFLARPEYFKPYNFAAIESWFYHFFAKENAIGVLIKDGEKNIGYALLFYNKGTTNPFSNPKLATLFVEQMSIEKEYQNQGIGVQLFEFIKTIAKEKKADKIQLTVWNTNAQAKVFYDKLGFKTIKQDMEYNM